MNRRERVIAALEHRETDIIPYQVGFTADERKKVAEYLQDPDFSEKINNHIQAVYYDGFLSEETDRSGYFSDDFGVCWNRTEDKDIGVVDDIVIKEPDLKNYKFPEIREETLRHQFKELINNGQDTFKIGNIGFSMFERAWTLRGMENLLMDMVCETAFVEELFDAICEFNLKIVDLALEYDLDGFMFGDDWGQQKGLIMGPGHWRKLIKPRMARMYARVKSEGKYVLQHSCGDIEEIFPDLIDIGLDVYNTFQPEIYDIAQVKEEFGEDLSFWGGISTQTLLPFASPEEVKERTVEIINIMKKDGGYIAGPTHAVPADVPPPNIIVMLEVLENQSRFF